MPTPKSPRKPRKTGKTSRTSKPKRGDFIPFLDDYLATIIRPRIAHAVNTHSKPITSQKDLLKVFCKEFGVSVSMGRWRTWIQKLGLSFNRQATIDFSGEATIPSARAVRNALPNLSQPDLFQPDELPSDPEPRFFREPTPVNVVPGRNASMLPVPPHGGGMLDMFGETDGPLPGGGG